MGAAVMLDLLLIDYDPKTITVAEITARIKEVGYAAVPAVP